MTSRLSKLVLAAALTGSIPAAASARDCDHDGGPAVRTTVVIPAAPVPVRDDAWRDRDDRDGWRGREWQERRWRERERERAEVRAELRALEGRRAEFHARNAWRPGQLRRFDRWYLERRAELERRYAELGRVAWR